MRYILYDLEATCWPAETPGVSQEIIEIGAYSLDRLGRIKDKFHQMVRPVAHPYLSPYCLQLTGIGQEEVDRAQPFPKVISRFIDWLEEEDDDYYLISWGSGDQQFFRQDCRRHRLDEDWLDGRCYNLKQLYKDQFKLPAKLGLVAALRREGLSFEGPTHRALSDAYNLACLFHRHIDIWPIP